MWVVFVFGSTSECGLFLFLVRQVNVGCFCTQYLWNNPTKIKKSLLLSDPEIAEATVRTREKDLSLEARLRPPQVTWPVLSLPQFPDCHIYISTHQVNFTALIPS